MIPPVKIDAAKNRHRRIQDEAGTMKLVLLASAALQLLLIDAGLNSISCLLLLAVVAQ